MDFWLEKSLAILLFLFVIRTSANVDYEGEDGKPSWDRCPWIRNKLKNGRVKIRSRGRIAKFLCNSGYEMVGKRFATCVRGKWNNPIPFCVARGCYKLPEPANGKVTEMYRGALLVYDCLPGYVLQGPMSLYCDGTRWSDAAPICDVANERPEPSCDFEDPDLCGWSHDPTHDFEWRRNQYGTPSGHVGTGPSYDHTYGKGKAGFYLYLEASSPRKENDTCRLFSPVFPTSYHLGCFTFWYHMYGATTGGLRLYVKPESHVFGELTPVWEKFGDQGNHWLKGEIDISPFSENFQLVIEGVRGTSYVGDTAIDDLKLWQYSCSIVSFVNETSIEVSSDSCRGRCREQDEDFACDCSESCIFNNTCCTDYVKICTSGGDVSPWDGETAPDFIVTDYLNAITEPQKPSSNFLTTTSTLEIQTTSTAISTASTSTSAIESTELHSSTIIIKIPAVPTTTSTTTSQQTIPTSISTERPSTLASSTTTTATSLVTAPPHFFSSTTTTQPIRTSPSTEKVTESTTKSTLSTQITKAESTIKVYSQIITVPPPSTYSTPSATTHVVGGETSRVQPTSSSSGYTSTLTMLKSTSLSEPTTKTAVVTMQVTLPNSTTQTPNNNITFLTMPSIKTTEGLTSNAIPIQPVTTSKPERYTARFPPRMNTLSTFYPTLLWRVTPTTSTFSTSTKLASTTFSTSTTTTRAATVSHSTTSRTDSGVEQPSRYRTTDKATTTLMEKYEWESVSHMNYEDDKYKGKNSVLIPSKSASKSQQTSSTSVAGVSVGILFVAVIICGVAYYFFKRRGQTQKTKLSDDSEIRFLSDNEVLEFSDGSEKMLIT